MHDNTPSSLPYTSPALGWLGVVSRSRWSSRLSLNTRLAVHDRACKVV